MFAEEEEEEEEGDKDQPEWKKRKIWRDSRGFSHKLPWACVEKGVSSLYFSRNMYFWRALFLSDRTDDSLLSDLLFWLFFSLFSACIFVF